MKICVSLDNRIRPDSTGMYFIPAFKNLGHTVTHVLPEDVLKLKGDEFDFYLKVDDGIDYEVWNPNLHPSAYYVIDTHLETDWRLKFEKLGKFDYVHVTQKQGLSLPWQASSKTWNPLACDIDTHCYGDPQEKIHDACFVGNFHSKYAGRRIAAVDILSKCVNRFFFTNVFMRDMAKVYAQSRIVFNCALNQDINMRFFEALCSGSALLTDRIPEIEEIGLKENVHYFAYEESKELVEKLQYMLNNQDLVESVAREGQSAAFRYHTYTNRAQKILEVANEHCAAFALSK